MTIRMIDIERQRAAMEPRLSQDLTAVLDHGRFINGPEVAELETALADYSGAKHVVACANGTDALQLLLRAADIGPGDAVFVPSLTYAATAEAVGLVGATPVFVDIDLATGNMSPDSLRATLADAFAAARLKPRAVIAVDLFGFPADHEAISEICNDSGLRFFIDAAQSFGTETPNGRACSFGDASATSFYPSKSLGAFGDGGAVFTNSEEFAAKIRLIANHGVSAGSHATLGTNSRLDTMQATILLGKLAIFDDELAARRRIAGRYGAAFDNYCQVPKPAEGVDPCWAYYVIRTEKRDALQAHLGERGVPSIVYYREATHQQPAFSSAPVAPEGLPNTEAHSASLLCLPSHPYMTEAEVDTVIEAVQSFFDAG